MTNPLSNLSKYTRKPFRDRSFLVYNDKLSNTATQKDISSFNSLDLNELDSDLSELLDEVTLKMVKSSRKTYASKQESTRNNCSARKNQVLEPLSADVDLMTRLLSRVKELELCKRYNEKVIKERDLRIRVLEEKAELYKRTRDVHESQAERSTVLEAQCSQLQQQVGEMEAFLADYGLVWVGGSGSSKQDQQIQETESGIAFHIDYDVVIRNVDELNRMVNAEESQVALTTPGRAQLRSKQNVPLTLYANGVYLFNGPFRAFSDESTRQIIQDLQDGFFPSELESQFPFGVPLQIKDRRSVFYEAELPTNIFQGAGRTLGGSGTMSEVVVNDRKSRDDVYSWPYNSVATRYTSPFMPAMTVDQFLSRLPSSQVSESGRLVAVRSEIRQILEAGEVTPDRMIPVKMEPPGATAANGDDSAAIKVRLESPDNTEAPCQWFQLTLSAQASVAELYTRLSALSGLPEDSFVLSSVYPRRQLRDRLITVKEAGCVPSASLTVEPVVPQSGR